MSNAGVFSKTASYDPTAMSTSQLSEIPESPKRLSVTPQENHPQGKHVHPSSSVRASTIASRSSKSLH